MNRDESFKKLLKNLHMTTTHSSVEWRVSYLNRVYHKIIYNANNKIYHNLYFKS